MIRIILIVFLFSSVVRAEDIHGNKLPNSQGWYGYDETLPDLLNIKGLTYHNARPIIISAGWNPLQTLQEGTEEFEQGAQSGNGPKFWSTGYYELQTCSGTGTAYCAFLFQNKKGDRLRIVTKYEEWDDSSFAEVAGYRFNP